MSLKAPRPSTLPPLRAGASARSARNRRAQRIAAAAALLLAAGAAQAQAPGVPPNAPGMLPVAALPNALTGNTVSAVMFLPHADQVDRVVFQAYLGPGGSELVRRWDPSHDRYTVPADARWTLAGATLCMSFPGLASGGDPDICIETHVWGPRISGNTAGAGRFALLNGDIEPGNSINRER